MLESILERAKADSSFGDIRNRFESAGIENWLKEEEKALHFGVGAYAPGSGSIVEIGTWQGGSACFLAAGIARRGTGRLTCVDPHMGGPPWLGLAPHQRTLEKFKQGVRYCGVADWIDARVGDSEAVASVWPAERIDAVFIDGDHSFRGALKDLQCWGPKVRPGGLVMFDDADDPALPELLELIDAVKGLGALSHLGTVEGVAVFEVGGEGAGNLLAELAEMQASRGLHAGWDMSFLHRLGLPPNYGRSRSWNDHGIDIAYQLCFLARCGPGGYGYTTASPPKDREFLQALSRDRNDGEVLEIRDGVRGLRALLCRPEEARQHASRLLTGGVLIARDRSRPDQERCIRVRTTLIEAGLDGCGWHEDVHWGVWQPHYLSTDAILHYASEKR